MIAENQTHGMICTYSGVLIEPLDPKPDYILIEDIAHALSNQCRFTGHVRKFYSVGEHSVRVSHWLEGERQGIGMAFIGLMHDASEAYLADIARPVKRQPEISQFYKTAEQRLEAVIADKFSYEYPYPEIVKRADDVLLRSEQRDLMPDIIRIPGDEYVPYLIEPWTPEEAEAQFLSRFEDLSRLREEASDN